MGVEINMKINIIEPVNPSDDEVGCYFAQRLCSKLEENGDLVIATNHLDEGADINHYCLSDLSSVHRKIDYGVSTTFLITNVKTSKDLSTILDMTDHEAVGICLSKEMRDFLITSGVKRNRICYINPANNGIIQPRKIQLGFTHRLYNDHRKKNDLIVDVCKYISPEIFSFIIMARWPL